MRAVATTAVVLVATALVISASTGAPARASVGARCKIVTKRVHGHRKRVKVCKAKPKPKPPPKPQADLVVTMQSTLQEVTAGNHVYYTLEVENHGPEVAEGVTISADVHADLVDVYSSGGTDPMVCNADRQGGVTHIECGSLTLSPAGPSDTGDGETPSQVNVQLTVEPDEVGAFTVSARARSSTHDPHPENNLATTPLAVRSGPASADLSVKLSSAPDPTSVTQGMTETISVTNAGPSEATDVYVTLLLPQGAALADFPVSLLEAEPQNGPCPADVYGFRAFAVACFNVIRRGETLTRTIHVLPSIHGPSVLETDAVVSAYTRDTNLANDRATVATALSPFQPTAGVDVATTLAPPATAIVGKPFTLQFHIRNLGLADAHGVTVKIATSPAVEVSGVAVIGDSDSGALTLAGCDADNECTIPTLPSDGVLTGVLLGKAATAGSYSATVNAGAAENDAAPTNNNASVSFAVSSSRAPR